MTHPKHGARVVFVILKGHTAIPRTVGIDVGLQPIISEGVLASQARRSRQVMGIALLEDTPSEARCLAVSVLRHIGCAGNRASGASTLSVEEDQEDQCTHEGKTANHSDHDTGDGAATQLAAASCRGVGRGGILDTCLAGGGNSDSLHLTGRGGLLDNIPSRGSRVECGGLERHVSKFEPT